MALCNREVWENIYKSRGGYEWYYPLVAAMIDEFDVIADGCPVLLHCGCGAFPISETPKYKVVLNFDFAFTVMTEIKIKNIICSNDIVVEVEQVDQGLDGYCVSHPIPGNACQLLVADARKLPFIDSSIDVILEKGLFDSMTCDTKSQIINAAAILEEYHRVLKPIGNVVILSIFEPCGDQKDMLGLLSHSGFTVRCRELHHPPAEIPSQQFCFVYVCTKQ